MRARNLSTWLGEGRDVAPSLALPSPKTKPGRLHKRIDTPEGPIMFFSEQLIDSFN
jgi:hypothetical protein